MKRPERLSLVDLSRALAKSCGHPDYQEKNCEQAPGAGCLTLPDCMDKLLFILLDGFGMNLVPLMRKNAVLARHPDAVISSVFPSSTASALTSLATARWPSEHCVTGWWVRMAEKGVSATVLPFEQRGTGINLSRLGITPEYAFPANPIVPEFRCKKIVLMPRYIPVGEYSSRMYDGADFRIWDDLPQAFAMAAAALSENRGKTFVYLYVPDVDSHIHVHGTKNSRLIDLLSVIDSLTTSLIAEKPHDSAIVITADHGLSDLPAATAFVLEDGDEIMSLLKCPPDGDPAVPVFHVKDGMKDRFEQVFRNIYGEHFQLSASSDAIQSGLFGPVPSGAAADILADRLGDFIAPCRKTAAFFYKVAGTRVMIQKGIHGSLSEQEMLVPLHIF